MTRDYSKFSLGGTTATPSKPTKLQTYGWQPFFAQQISIDELEQTPPARVIEVNRNTLHVVGETLDEMIPPVADVTVGDWVLVNAEQPAQSRVLDRKSLVKRRAPGHDRQLQLIAANIDTAFIVTSCNADFNVARLERYIALALEAEITPVIILTKLDMVEDASDYLDQARAISDLVDVIALDARGSDPREKLGPWCKPGQTIAFLGSSGVGKSTLTNALAGSDAIATQAIREDDARGRHTTTKRQLHPMPSGCLVLDTPGMRELQMTEAAAGIGELFSDLQELATQCRFNDCKHESEPGCAVLKALEVGQIDEARLNRWRKLMAEEAFNTASLSERRSKDKAFGKMVRRTIKQKHTGKWQQD
ncbi:MAG: ribosome small subunit-dependent GTPase A [Pseudomonadota bacterium]